MRASDTRGVAVGHNVTAQQFDRLPKARTFQGLALLSPSVDAREVEGGFQVNGASGAENQFIIDGIFGFRSFFCAPDHAHCLATEEEDVRLRAISFSSQKN